MVVAPYNDQKDLLRAKLDANPATIGLQVGTVDKFQGRQAPITIYSMAASSAEDAPRGMDFLYDLHRLNVAVSRAAWNHLPQPWAWRQRSKCTPRGFSRANR